MDFSKLFDLITPLSVFLASVLGTLLGFLVISLTPTARTSAVVVIYMLTLIAAAFFIPIILDRAIENIANWERSVGTWITFQIFISTIGVGVTLRNRFRSSN